MQAILKTINDFYQKLSLQGRLTAAGILLVLSATLGASLSSNNAGRAEQSDNKKTIPVTVTIAKKIIFYETVGIQGNIEAKNFANVSPRIYGVIEAIYVDEGDNVTANKTLLFKTDSLKIEKALEISEKNLEVAKCALEQAKAALEKTNADFNKAQLDYDRFTRLHEKKAVTDNEYELQESRFKQLTAAKKLAEAQVNLSTEQLNQAQTALEIAKKDLADTRIIAPISGKISERLAEPGEMGEPGKAVLKIDDVNIVEISAFLPSIYYANVHPEKTTIKVTVFDSNIGTYHLSYKSPTINPQLRTFEIKCTLENPPANAVPGAMANLDVIFEEKTAIGVPLKAVISDTEGSAIFIVVGNTAQKLHVKTGTENDGWIEISQPKLCEGTSVVTMGQFDLTDGVSVSIQKGQN